MRVCDKGLSVTSIMLYCDLEKTGNMLVSPSPVTANSMYLSNDPAIDKTPVYQQILQAYKWSNKISDLSGLAANVLEAQNKLKRSQPITIMQAKRPKRLPPTGHAFPQTVVEQTLNRLRKLPEISDIKTTHPLGSHAVLQITLGSVLKAQVALRGLMIEWVNVRGYTEENPDDSKLELWAKSRYEVFQKVTESCTAASLYFYTPHNAEFAINLFMKWFTQYRTLFSAKCSKCCNHYLNGLPPTWRDLATYEPYHDACRQ
ncbi:mediator of RNA polymerase II transcription subunit 27-A-like isoform X2 [Dreissena polymorpha]|uniref:mediator of RNA polymerase II transcription subunit 27-A-like isoform X2 n=1 Tax=Dreissena polymorpha TaxID=45954 RepID=UPI002264126E|nr:mediator of RNA polymerase II transcription subunit 27-A-like isoform X2 [Dreissena polymorpha]